jgi:hypothetical protein
MMLVVVKFERLLRHEGRERIMCIGEVWQREGHGINSLGRVGKRFIPAVLFEPHTGFHL